MAPNWKPNRTTLRQFAGLWLLFFLSLAAYRLWSSGAWDHPFGYAGPWKVPITLGSVAVVAGVPGLLAPSFMRPLYVGSLAVSLPIGWVVSHALLAVVYFGLFTALAAVFRFAGRDRLGLRADRSQTTYWRNRPLRSRPAQYFRLS